MHAGHEGRRAEAERGPQAELDRGVQQPRVPEEPRGLFGGLEGRAVAPGRRQPACSLLRLHVPGLYGEPGEQVLVWRAGGGTAPLMFIITVAAQSIGPFEHCLLYTSPSPRD